MKAIVDALVATRHRGAMRCVSCLAAIVAAACGRAGFDYGAGSDPLATDAMTAIVETDAAGDAASGCVECVATSIAFVAATSGANEGASVAFSHTVSPGNGRLLLVGAHVASKTYTTASVTYGGIPLLQIDTSIEANTLAEDCSSTLWYLVDPPTGDAVVVANIEASTRPMAAWAMSFTGVDPNAPIIGSELAVGSTLATSASVSIASAPGQLIVDNYCMAVAPPASLSAGANQLERVRQDDTSNEMRIAASTQPGGQSPAMGWTFDSAYYTLRAAVLRPAAN